jgi:hypothetical protein
MGPVNMLTLIFLLLVSSAVVVILPLSVLRTPQVKEIQGIIGSVCACVAS